VIEGPESIQTDAYALCALVEYARASGREEPVTIAYETFARTLTKIGAPGSYRTKPYPMMPGTKAQRVSMQFSLAYHDLARFTGDSRVLTEAMRLTCAWHRHRLSTTTDPSFMTQRTPVNNAAMFARGATRGLVHEGTAGVYHGLAVATAVGTAGGTWGPDAVWATLSSGANKVRDFIPGVAS